MYTRHLSTLLALPLMAFLIACVGGIPTQDILSEVIGKGALKYNEAFTTAMFGAVLAELVNKQSIAKSMIRYVAEFGGDNPFVLGILLTLVTALLFSTLGGLGAVIMAGTIVLPVMLSLAIPAVTAGGLFLFGIAMGGMLNLTNWTLYMNVLGLTRQEIISFIVPFSAIVAASVLIFLLIELRSWKNIKAAFVALIILALGYGALYMRLHGEPQQGPVTPSDISIQIATVVFFLLIAHALFRHFKKITTTPGFAVLTPVIPLILVLGGQWQIIPAFVAGITFGVLSCWQRTSINTLTRSIIEGISASVPAVVLIIGLGMLVISVMHPNVSTAMAPLLKMVVPTHALPYIITFTLIAPLALYRGPLNVWGMGSGLVKLIQSATTLGSKAILAMLWSVGQIQGICDPANTQNLWVATYLGVDTQALMVRTLPYAWTLAFLGLCLAVSFGYVPW